MIFLLNNSKFYKVLFSIVYILKKADNVTIRGRKINVKTTSLSLYINGLFEYEIEIVLYENFAVYWVGFFPQPSQIQEFKSIPHIAYCYRKINTSIDFIELPTPMFLPLFHCRLFCSILKIWELKQWKGLFKIW